MKNLVWILSLGLLTFGCGEANKNRNGSPNNKEQPGKPTPPNKGLDKENESQSLCANPFATEPLCMDIQWLIGPDSIKPNAFTVTFTSKKEEPLSPNREISASVIYLSNPNGTVSDDDIFALTVQPKVDDNDQVVPGSFTVSGINFVPGQWAISIGLLDKSGQLEEEISPQGWDFFTVQ